MSNSFVNETNSTRPGASEYTNVIKDISNKGICPFCPEHFTSIHPKPLLIEGEYWVGTENAYPYPNTSQHLLIVHREHIEKFDEITPEAWENLRVVVNGLFKLREINGGTLVFRTGETKFTGASVTHLHAQLISGQGDNNADPVLARVG